MSKKKSDRKIRTDFYLNESYRKYKARDKSKILSIMNYLGYDWIDFDAIYHVESTRERMKKEYLHYYRMLKGEIDD